MPNIDKAVISVHCHNDLGLAVANSLAGVENGAGQIECTINGIGERAGNCSLEEVVMALRTRSDYYHADTASTRQRLVPTSRLVSNVTGMQVQRNKAIVGRNAFAHEAGIHQDGMLKERTTYEIMRPEDVGFAKTDLVLGKHSGRAALADRAKALGYHLTDEQLQTVFEQFKMLADKKKEIYDADIAALIEQRDARRARRRGRSSRYQRGRPAPARRRRVTLTLQHGDEEVDRSRSPAATARSTPCFWRSSRSPASTVVCQDFRVHSVTVGKDAQAEVNVEARTRTAASIAAAASRPTASKPAAGVLERHQPRRRPTRTRPAKRAESSRGLRRRFTTETRRHGEIDEWWARNVDGQSMTILSSTCSIILLGVSVPPW